VTATATGAVPAGTSDVYLGAGLPGFPGARHFHLSPCPGAGSPFALLSCLDVGGLDFVVVPAELFFPGYHPEIDPATAERIGLGDPADARVYVIVTPGASPGDATANLLGPLVVNHRNQLAAQVVTERVSGDVHVPLVKRSR
jgi:flagellar assembly factor FliW